VYSDRGEDVGANGEIASLTYPDLSEGTNVGLPECISNTGKHHGVAVSVLHPDKSTPYPNGYTKRAIHDQG
jgi:hypothetical protein